METGGTHPDISFLARPGPVFALSSWETNFENCREGGTCSVSPPGDCAGTLWGHCCLVTITLHRDHVTVMALSGCYLVISDLPPLVIQRENTGELVLWWDDCDISRDQSGALSLFQSFKGLKYFHTFACSSLVLYGIRDRWLPCTERIYHGGPWCHKEPA